MRTGGDEFVERAKSGAAGAHRLVLDTFAGLRKSEFDDAGDCGYVYAWIHASGCDGDWRIGGDCGDDHEWSAERGGELVGDMWQHGLRKLQSDIDGEHDSDDLHCAGECAIRGHGHGDRDVGE